MKFIKAIHCVAIASAITFFSLSAAGFTYSQDFEDLDRNDPDALANDGWQVGGNVFEQNGDFVYSYFAFPAPNVSNCTGGAFSCILSTEISSGLDGPHTGSQWLNVYNDYENSNHSDGSGRLIEANTFFDLGFISADDVGNTISVSFDARLFNIGGRTTAAATVKVLDSLNGSFSLLGSDSIDMLGGSVNTSGWTEGLTLSLVIDSAWVGQLVQLDFISTAMDGEPSGIFYDNIYATSVPVPGAVWLFGTALAGLSVLRRKPQNIA